ncbi:MAG: hypothetical protein ACJAUA_000134, partial [Zhongshania aliphaticivorans]
ELVLEGVELENLTPPSSNKIWKLEPVL